MIGTCTTVMAHLATCTVTCNTGYSAVSATHSPTPVPTPNPTPVPTPSPTHVHHNHHQHHAHHNHHNHFWGRRRLLAAALRTSEVRGDVGNNQRPAAFGGRSLSAANYSSKRNKNVDHSHTPGPTAQARRHALDEASVLNLVPPAANNTTQSLADPFFDMDPIDSSFPAPAPDLSPTASSGQDSTRSAVSATIPVGISDLFRRRGSTGNRCLQTQTPFSVPEFPLNSVTHHFI